MSYQVGLACYSSLAGAGAATCAGYSPVSSLVQDGAVLRSVSCISADPETGALKLRVLSTPVDGSPPAVAFVSDPVEYFPCRYGDFVLAGAALVGPVLAILVMIWCARRFVRVLDWARSDVS